MTKFEFLKKYPELDEDGDVSKVKISLLVNYSTHYLSRGDEKIRIMLEEYNNVVITERRDIKIDTILLEKSLRKLKTSLLLRPPLV